MGEEREGWERMREMGAERIKKRGNGKRDKRKQKFQLLALSPNCFEVIRIN